MRPYCDLAPNIYKQTTTGSKTECVCVCMCGKVAREATEAKQHVRHVHAMRLRRRRRRRRHAITPVFRVLFELFVLWLAVPSCGHDAWRWRTIITKHLLYIVLCVWVGVSVCLCCVCVFCVVRAYRSHGLVEKSCTMMTSTRTTAYNTGSCHWVMRLKWF